MGSAQVARPILKTYRFTKAIVTDANAVATLPRPSRASLLAADCHDTSNDSYGFLPESNESFDAEVTLSLARVLCYVLCFALHRSTKMFVRHSVSCYCRTNHFELISTSSTMTVCAK